LEVLAVPRLCELYPRICLSTDDKARKNLSYGSGVKIHFTFPHACSTQLNSYLLLCMTCWCVIIFFREMSLFLTAGEAAFGPARGVIMTAVVRVAVPLVTAITNWSAMVSDPFFR
jgi:hypothetical protein